MILLFNSLSNNAVKNSYKCPFCSLKFRNPNLLYLHIDAEHEYDLPNNTSAKKYVYDIKHPGDHMCQICKTRECVWKEKTGRYSTLCDDSSCRERARQLFLENYKNKHNKDHTISDPEVQREMAKRKKNSGEYKFQDGGKIAYVSSYELDFLKFCDLYLDMDSSFVSECLFNFKYTYEGKEHFYLPDYYIKAYDLIIEIKADDQVTHPKILAIDKEMEVLKEESVRKNSTHNYIKICDKNYDDFIKLIDILKNEYIDSEHKEGTRYVIIPDRVKTIRGFTMPKLEFISDKKLLKEDTFLSKMWDSTSGLVRFDLIINREYLPKELYKDPVFNDEISNIDLGQTKFICRSKEFNINDNNKLDRCFKEFKNYYTKHYEKFINQNYMSVLSSINNKKYIVINIKFIKDSSRDELLDKVLKYIITEYDNSICTSNAIGADVIIEYDGNKAKKQKLKNIMLEINKNKEFFSKKLENNIIFEAENFAPPGTVDGGVDVLIDEKYSNIKG